MLGALASLAFGGCSHESPGVGDKDASVVAARQRVIYGADDRTEPFAHPDAALAALVRNSVVAVVPASGVGVGEGGEVELASVTLAEAHGLCAGEPFAEQPTAAVCSGVLVAPDVVLTATHCLRLGFGAALACDQLDFVFDYFEVAEGRLEAITGGDVFRCASFRELAGADGGASGVVAVRLDGKVGDGRRPVLLGHGSLVAGASLAVLGFPSGLPAKIDTGATVLEPPVAGVGSFTLEADTFASSSGSGIFDASRELVGVFLSGAADFEPTEAGCTRARRVPAADAETHEIGFAITGLAGVDAGFGVAGGGASGVGEAPPAVASTADANAATPHAPAAAPDGCAVAPVGAPRGNASLALGTLLGLATLRGRRRGLLGLRARAHASGVRRVRGVRLVLPRPGPAELLASGHRARAHLRRVRTGPAVGLRHGGG